MKRLTYDFAANGQHCWQVKGADNDLCKDVCRDQGDNGCKDCPIAKAFDRLAAYEDTGLEPEEICGLQAHAEFSKGGGQVMEKLRQRFTEWYFRHGWTFEYTLGGKPTWNCPFYVKPLLVLFSPSVYFMRVSSGFARGFEEAFAEALAERDEDK